MRATSRRSPRSRSPRTATRARRTGSAAPRCTFYRDQAKRLFKAAGRDIEVEEIPVETLKRELVRAGVPPWNAEGLKELFEVYASGRRADGDVRRQGRPGARPARHRHVCGRPRRFVQGAGMRSAWARESRRLPATGSSRSSIPTRSSTPRRASRSRSTPHGRAARDAPGSRPHRHRGPRPAAAGHRRRLPAPAPAQPPPGQAARAQHGRHLRRAAQRRLDQRRPGRSGEPDRRPAAEPARKAAGCRSSASTISRA